MKINFHICRKLNLQPYYVKKIFPYDLYRRVKASVNHYSLESHVIETDYSYSLESTPTVERPIPFDPDQYVNEYLPSEYYEPEWIEPLNQGNSYQEVIDTGITHTPNTRVEFQMMPHAKDENFNILFCSRDNDLAHDFAMNTKYHGTNGLYVLVGRDEPSCVTRVMDLTFDTSIYTISCSQTEITVQVDNEAPVTTTLNGYTNTGVRTLTLWNCHATDDPASIIDGSTNRFYYFKIYEGDTLVRDFRPAIRRADGVAGLYDLVEGQFYENINTTSTTNFKTDLDTEIPSRLNPADRIASSNEVLYTGNNLYTLTKTETINPNP